MKLISNKITYQHLKLLVITIIVSFTLGVIWRYHSQAALTATPSQSKWISAGPIPWASHIFSFAVYNNRLYAGNHNGGEYYRYDGKVWTNIGSGNLNGVMTSIIYNRSLFTGKTGGHVFYYSD